MNEPRIAIVGAGVGGLVTARTLQLHGYPVTLFEREESRHARWQGGTLDLHAPTGQVAMRAAGLFTEFESLARPEAQELRFFDPITAELVHHEKPDTAKLSAPEIDRGQLRELLLDSLVPDTVHWGVSIERVTPLENGTARLHLRDGSVHDFDLVIGADGAWSKVRRALSGATPAYMGSTLFETALDDVDTRHPELAELIGPGTAGATAGEGVMLSAQRNSNGHVRVYAGFDLPADWYVTEGVDLANADAVRDYVLGRFEGWHPLLLDLIRRHDEEFVNRALHILPIGHSWPHVPGITLVGDAAHLMPPYGVGANLALADGAGLAESIATHDALDDAVRAYEKVMFARATAAAEACAELTETMARDAPLDIDSAREAMNERMAAAISESAVIQRSVI